MKKGLLLLFVLSIILGCSRQTHYTITTQRDINENTFHFTADSDESAQTFAHDWVKKYLDNEEQNYGFASLVKSHVSFRLTKEIEGKAIRLPFDYRDIDFFNREAMWIAEEEIKAFAGSLFGMTTQEVASLPHFKHYSKHSTGLFCLNEQIGNRFYSVTLFFGNNNELYDVQFLGGAYNDASSSNSAVRMDVENFNDVIQEAYGKGLLGLEYLSPENAFLYGGGKVYEYSIGNKNIEIGVAKSDMDKYFMFAHIVDTNRQQIEKDLSIKNSATLF